MDKVYCKDCRHLVEHKMSGKPEAWDLLECHARQYIEYIDSWYEREVHSTGDPMVINKNNDCQWFELKYHWDDIKEGIHEQDT